VCVNADQHFVVMAKDPEFFAGKYNIGVWFWELPSFPDKWRDRFAHYDEIWVGSSYIANTIAPLSPVPVVRIPPVLVSEVIGDRERGRRALGRFGTLTTRSYHPNAAIARHRPKQLMKIPRHLPWSK
jgi:hypothetical protein